MLKMNISLFQKEHISTGLAIVLIISYIEFLIFLIYSVMTMTKNSTMGLIEIVFSVVFVIIVFFVQINNNIARMVYVAIAVVEFFLFMTFINIWVAIIPIIPAYVLVFDKTTLELFERNKAVANQNVS